jgi:hypothetical protein
VPGHRLQVLEQDRTNADRDAVLFHRPIGRYVI